MAQFYDQDNPHASYNRLDVSDNRYDNNFAAEKFHDAGKYVSNAENLVKKSVMSPAQKERARVIKAQQRRHERRKRTTALAMACMIVGGIAVGVASEVAEIMEENSIVYEQTSAFANDVIYPNTHRTMNDKYYYYDYDDIAEAIQQDGKDFSTELYKAYAYLGEEQTNRVMQYTDYSSVHGYATAAGYDNIDDWVKSEREKILLQSEVASKQSELDAMHSELNGAEVLGAVEDSYTGGK